MEQPVAPVRRPFRLRTFGLAALLGALVLSTVVAAPPDSAVAAGPVSISGVILDSDGSTAGGQHIEAYLADGGPGWGTFASWDQAALGGEFRLDGLEAGREYRLRINWSTCCGALNTAPSFPGFVTNDPVDTMTQEPGLAALFDPGALGLTGLTVRLEPSTTMTGRVMTQDGTPLPGIELHILPDTDQRDIFRYGSHISTSHAVSAADGTFRAEGLEYIGEELRGYFVRPSIPNTHTGFVGSDPSSGLVPIDQARIFAPVREGITAVDIVIPQVRLPADQILLGRRLSSTDSWGQIMAVGSGTLSVFSLGLPGGVIEDSLAVRTGFEDERVYAPGDWGGVALDWLENENPEASHFEYHDDLVTVDELGDMYLYEGDGHSSLREPERIGWGWSGYRVIPVGDLDRVLDQRGRPDLLAIDRNGDLWLYRGDGEGGFLWPPRQVGNGWNGYDLYAAGDLNRDGRNDILSVDTRGDLWMYAGIGDGTFATRMKVGNGWGTYTLAAGADIDGYMDSTSYPVKTEADIVGRDDATGDLYLYSGLGSGFFDTKRLIATGW
jgi:hypothetical protein